jgi:hypothetical protein
VLEQSEVSWLVVEHRKPLARCLNNCNVDDFSENPLKVQGGWIISNCGRNQYKFALFCLLSFSILAFVSSASSLKYHIQSNSELVQTLISVL